MRYLYYPGCTLKTTGKVFDDSIKELSKILEIELVELPSWYCCQAIYTSLYDTPSLLLGPIRNLIETQKEDNKLVTACAACYNVLLRAQDSYFKDAILRERIKAYLEEELKNKIKIIHFFELLEEKIELINSLIKKKNDYTLAFYYGCLLTRPKGIALFSNDVNPNRFEKFFSQLGFKVVDFAFKTRCCGSYLTYTVEEAVRECVEKIVVSIDEKVADEKECLILTSCPLCQFNLENYQNKYKIFYFTYFLLSLIKGE
ncbi:MAG: heterodisulfide reductase-related iron-sulfur binding cluster [candidate division WOR-3 bacterium]|nr:heterodisulfide reductase-related iron-sulfur binding cluster [candidate division WOR-3 bacterium]MCX7837326.1 heterodisulfide reductase-related iron-sulfur binding cluster [candidate division WOR-3 bacterium]MDW8114611.1 heterodisulfide reductase-related iron-sulfur binding cluster [candidate division WOR-3 bacterium]